MPRQKMRQPSFELWQDDSESPSSSPKSRRSQVGPKETPSEPTDASVRSDSTRPLPKVPEDGLMPDLSGRKVVLVDSHSLIYQVFHALPPMTSPQGWPVSAVHGFTSDLLDLIERKKPDFVICAFDKGDKTFRNQLYDQYKANRDPAPEDLKQQFPLIHRVVATMGIGKIDCEGFEADDILATVSKQIDDAGGECLVVTSDKDCRQLITDRVRMYNIRKDHEMTASDLWDDWGVRPDQVVDYQSLVGDPVDNVPGIALIGPKLARQLLEKFDTLEGVLENAGSVSGPKRKKNLLEGRDIALLSRELVRLRQDVPCSVPWSQSIVGAVDIDALTQLFDEFGFQRLKTRAKTVLAGMGEEARASDWKTDYQTVATVDQLNLLVERLKTCKQIAVDTETTSTNPRRADLVGISICWAPGEAVYIPVRSPEGDPKLLEATVVDALRPVFENAKIGKIGQNLKYDVVVLRSVGIRLLGIDTDTMVADYLLDPGRRNHSLDELARRYLDHDTIKIQSLIGTGKKQKLISDVPVEWVTDYAAEDVDVPMRIAASLNERLAADDLKVLFDTIEMPLVEVLAELEYNGIHVDVAKLQEMSQTFAEEIESLRDKIHTLVGHPFNLDSPKQLAAVLFDELNLPVIKKTKTGVSTDADVLQQLAPLHPAPQWVLAYRQATKLKSTYIDALPLLVNPKTNRIHTSFRQDVAATGRLSSSEPNLQNIPIRTEQGRAIRSAFRAGPEGWLLLGADYSQIELRMLAHYSGDQALLEAYTHDADIHTRVAAEVHGVSESEVDSDMRRTAKTINFGIIYGQSPFGLAKTLGISKDEAAQYIELYFQRYPGVQEFMLKTLSDCRQQGYVATMFGRRRPIQGVRSLQKLGAGKQFSLTEAERVAVNTVIQGSAADLIKLAMLHVYKRLSEGEHPAKMLLQIHDELLFEVPPDSVNSLSEIVRKEMTDVVQLRVPLKVDLAFGNHWAEV